MILYKLLLDFIYYWVIAKFYSYDVFSKDFSIQMYILSWIIFFISYVSLKKVVKTTLASNSLISISFIYFCFIPFLTMMSFNNFSFSFILYNLVYWIIYFLNYLYLKNISNKRRKKIKLVKIKISYSIKKVFLFFIIFLMLGTVLFISYREAKFRIIFNLYEVYKYREVELNYSIIIIYILSWTKFILTFFLVYLYMNKNKLWIVLAIVQFLNFGIYAAKSIVFNLILSILILFFWKKRYNKKITFFINSFLVVSLLEVKLLNKMYLIDFIVRRLFFLTVKINYFYYDFFSKNSPDYFKQSFLRHFGLVSSYKDIPLLIGNVYHKTDIHYNSGLISDGLQNLGIIGVFIFPIILSYFVCLLEKTFPSYSNKLTTIISIYLFFSLVSSTFLAALLSHGLLILLVLLFMLKDRSNLRFLE